MVLLVDPPAPGPRNSILRNGFGPGVVKSILPYAAKTSLVAVFDCRPIGLKTPGRISVVVSQPKIGSPGLGVFHWVGLIFVALIKGEPVNRKPISCVGPIMARRVTGVK
jgi:hypothetical protein